LSKTGPFDSSIRWDGRGASARLVRIADGSYLLVGLDHSSQCALSGHADVCLGDAISPLAPLFPLCLANWETTFLAFLAPAYLVVVIHAAVGPLDAFRPET